MKALPDVIGNVGKSKLWGLRIDNKFGLMVGKGETLESIKDELPLVKFLKWSPYTEITEEWEEEINKSPATYTDPFWREMRIIK